MRLSLIRAPGWKLLLFLAAVSLFGAGRQFDEYEIKAGFLLNFARFVDWPAEVFAAERDVVPVCIWEPDPFGHSLDRAAAQQTIAGHPIEIRRISDPSQVAGCRVLFARSVSRHDTSFLKERFLLVVSEKGSDAASAAAINFTLDDTKVRFEVNLNPLQRADLRLSSRLLSLAATVKKP